MSRVPASSGSSGGRDQMASFPARPLGLLETAPSPAPGWSGSARQSSGSPAVASSCGRRRRAGSLWEPGSTTWRMGRPRLRRLERESRRLGVHQRVLRPANTHRDRRRTVGWPAGSRTSPLRWPLAMANTWVRRSSFSRSSAVPTSSYARASAEKACVPRSTIQSSTRRSAVVADVAGVESGASPEVRSCADYRDDLGHLTETAVGPIGEEIAEFYSE